MYHIFDPKSGKSRMIHSLLDLGSVLAHEVDAGTKGFPKSSKPLMLAEIADQRWNLLRGDVSLPAAVIRESALQHNIDWMRAYATARDVQLCPHGKTTMCPQLFDRQLQAGAWGLTAATLTHVEVYLQHGVRRIIYANQLVANEDIDYVIAQLQAMPDLEFFCLVDSVENVRQLSQRVQAAGSQRPLQLLLEMGIPGGRCGVRTEDQALQLARVIKAAAPALALCGVEAFEGIVDLASQAGKDQVSGLLSRVVNTAAACQRESLFAPGAVLLTAGGSACFDLVAQTFCDHGLEGEVEVVIRSGCYVVHDHGFYAQLAKDFSAHLEADPELSDGLQPALEVWARVQSVPEPGLAIVAMGKRDAGYDMSLPELQWLYRPGRDLKPQRPMNGCRTQAMNDQHLYLRFPETMPIGVGDLLGFGVSHPCTTFDKWQLLYVVDDEYTVSSALKTFF
jgi:D-serine dehydratase